MAENKFNLSKGEEKKGFNLSKSSENKASKYNLSKQQPPVSTSSSSGSTNKSKWWLWLLLAVVVIVGIVLISKNYSSEKPDKSLLIKTEQATAKANEIIADVQSGNVNYENVKEKVAEAQKAVDEAKANAKTQEEKQTVADAQAKVNEAASAVDNSNESAKPVATDDVEAPGQSDQPAKPAQPDQQEPVTVSVGTLEMKAKEVISGKYGNGADRKRALGSEYAVIQNKVNEMYRKGEVN